MNMYTDEHVSDLSSAAQGMVVILNAKTDLAGQPGILETSTRPNATLRQGFDPQEVLERLLRILSNQPVRKIRRN